MTRRMHDGRRPAAAPAEQQADEQVDQVPARGVRVAGEVHNRELTQVERIAGVLEVTTWIKRLFPSR